MDKQYVIEGAILLTFYLLGAYATTDMIRLVSGSDLSVGQKGCFCSHCGRKIPLWEQIPVFSYIFLGGKCKGCREKIPSANFLLELVVFSGMALLSFRTDFGFFGLWCCVLYYEAVKFFYVLYKGRCMEFEKNLAQSFASNTVLFLLLLFLFFVRNVIL